MCVWEGRGGGRESRNKEAFHLQLCDALKYCENCIECTMIEG